MQSEPLPNTSRDARLIAQANDVASALGAILIGLTILGCCVSTGLIGGAAHGAGGVLIVLAVVSILPISVGVAILKAAPAMARGSIAATILVLTLAGLVVVGSTLLIWLSVHLEAGFVTFFFGALTVLGILAIVTIARAFGPIRSLRAGASAGQGFEPILRDNAAA